MTTTLLDSVIDPLAECMTMEAARKIVALRLNDAEQAHLDRLADRANHGTLSSEEKVEYDEFLAIYHVVSLLQARARQLLKA